MQGLYNISDFQTQQAQEESVSLQISKLTPNTLVISRPVKLIWERNRPAMIRASLETTNSTVIIGDRLVAVGENRNSGLFDKYHAKLPPANSASGGMFPVDSYQCGPLKFKFNRSMLILDNAFRIEDPLLLTNAKLLKITFKA